MNETATQNILAYASQKNLEIGVRLGFGVHGIVLAVEHKLNHNSSAIKAHSAPEPYLRERQAYERLREAKIVQILGFNVPQLISFEDSLQLIEMTIVKRPFVLDFAGAYLDSSPEFSDEIWTQWEKEKREQFGTRWAVVQQLLSEFERFDIYIMDVTPSNIGFLEQ